MTAFLHFPLLYSIQEPRGPTNSRYIYLIFDSVRIFLPSWFNDWCDAMQCNAMQCHLIKFFSFNWKLFLNAWIRTSLIFLFVMPGCLNPNWVLLGITISVRLRFLIAQLFFFSLILFFLYTYSILAKFIMPSCLNSFF